METAEAMTREELGDHYYKLWGFCGYETQEEQDDRLGRMTAIREELGEDFMLVIRLKREIEGMAGLAEDVRQLKRAIRELHEYKANRKNISNDGPFYDDCQSIGIRATYN